MNRRAKQRHIRKWLLFALLLAVVAIVAGCRTLGYYGQAIKGQYQIVARRQAIDKLIADPQTPGRLKDQLEIVQNLRAFASAELKLPMDGYYTKYADLERRFVVWNVQAAGEFSLQPKTWWYPFVGSLEYRGYFSEAGATNCARRLAAKGYDVYVDGVAAYSTLGWFADPVLNTYVYGSPAQLAEILFHELAHQRVFARGDTDFNEAFATTVGQEGARRWLRARGDTNVFAAYLLGLRRNDEFVHLIMNTRTNLERLYGDTRGKDGKIKAAATPPVSAEELRRGKQHELDDLRRSYTQLKERWGGYSGYDEWFSRDLNNAQLNTVANYYDLVPAFERLLQANGGDLEKFYEAVERLARLSKEERHERLRKADPVPEKA